MSKAKLARQCIDFGQEDEQRFADPGKWIWMAGLCGCCTPYIPKIIYRHEVLVNVERRQSLPVRHYSDQEPSVRVIKGRSNA